MTKRRALCVIALCAVPYAVLPPLGDALPEAFAGAISFVLCYVLAPVSAAFVPFYLARRGMPAIAAWPWPVLAALLLPLWGLQPSAGVMAVSALLGVLSAVAGEEAHRRAARAKRPTRGRRKR